MTDCNRNTYPGGEVSSLPSPLPQTGTGGVTGDQLPTEDKLLINQNKAILAQLKIITRHWEKANDIIFTEKDIS